MVLPLIQFFNKLFLTDTKNILTLGEISIRSVKEQYGSICIASWSKFARDIGKINTTTNYTFFIKVDRIFLKVQHESTCIVPDSNFLKDP